MATRCSTTWPDMAERAREFVDLMDSVPASQMPASIKQAREREAQASLKVVPDARATGLAGAGVHLLRPLRHEHLHRPRMGRRQGRPEAVQPHGLRRPAVGRRPARRRASSAHPHRQAPRRLLPVAEPLHRALRQEQPLERRQGRRGARGLRRLPRGRAQVRRLPLALGPPRAELRRFPDLQRLLQEPAPRAADQLRRHHRGLVRRRLRRRPQRQEAGLRLDRLLRGSSASCSPRP